jgi:phospholipase C
MTLNFDRLKTSDAPRRTLALLLALTTALGPTAAPAFAASKPVVRRSAPVTATPIQHLVVIFQENISFDHYFGTYPVATNPAGEPKFTAAPNTPTVNGLTNALLTFNPNLNPANGAAAANPFRLDRSQAVTTDQDHSYTAEQQAFDAGLMDLFPVDTGFSANTVMGYFDGNTATAMWNYAQFFAMSDNSYGTTFGPSSPGVVNLVSGQTNGVIATLNGTGDEVNGGPDGSLTLIGDADPIGDVCSSSTRAQATMGSQNIGNLLSAANITWGSFMGGFNLSIVNPNGTTGCNRSSTGLAGTTSDYIPHHSFFNYYTSTSNTAHTRPAS